MKLKHHKYFAQCNARLKGCCFCLFVCVNENPFQQVFFLVKVSTFKMQRIKKEGIFLKDNLAQIPLEFLLLYLANLFITPNGADYY